MGALIVSHSRTIRPKRTPRSGAVTLGDTRDGQARLTLVIALFAGVGLIACTSLLGDYSVTPNASTTSNKEQLRACALASACPTPTEIDTAFGIVRALTYFNGSHYGAMTSSAGFARASIGREMSAPTTLPVLPTARPTSSVRSRSRRRHQNAQPAPEDGSELGQLNRAACSKFFRALMVPHS